ncbi:hypothetical protein SAMN05421594_4759 [Chryseobacterium oleae]|uniref:Uncharacterized protein n=1 Tax=Chryseobacterium oleae TaxID=491207 RepID=A0A1I5D114_CHROL|nr:hypothetical protein [Chryseobacterium oleae]SFN92837.1 hypothetical protein SAMN05421594_4759 [Chryseobacterium oleae]
MGKFILLTPLIFTVFILFMNYRRKKSRQDGVPVSLASFIYPGLVVFAVSSLFFGLVSFISYPVISFFSSPRYEARVVEYDSSQSYGDETKKAVVEFRDQKNQLIKKPLNYGSSHPVEIGRIITIGYEDGDHSVTNLSFGTQKLIIFIISLFLFLLGLAMAWIILYSLGQDYSIIFRIGIGFVMYLVFPAAMLFFIGVMSWVIWEYFQGRRNDMPIWALGICSLFVTILIPAFFGYLKMLFTKEKTIRKKSRFSTFKNRMRK